MFMKLKNQKKKGITKFLIIVSLMAFVLSFGGCANDGTDGSTSKSQQEEQKGSQGAEGNSQDGKQGNDAVNAVDDSKVNEKLLGYGQKVLDLMMEKIQSDTYIDVMGYSSSLAESEYFQKLKAADYTKPQKIYVITLKEEFINLIWAEAVDKSLSVNDLSDELQNELRGRIASSIITIMNQRMTKVETVAIGSLLSTGKSFVASGLAKDPKLLLYVYEDAYPLVVTAAENDEGVLGVVSNILFLDDFKPDTTDDVRTSLSEAFSGVSQFMAGANIIIEQIQ